ncbi:MAG TPA: hypothetical protein VMS31_18640, partial [Pyrinomonadaceae bacterium]|nr:hypothetical protein [Pyrinomonadaceae bacterium]
MKQGKNSEIELLLRSLARGERAEPSLDFGHGSSGKSQVFSDHLDADELSSFAEGVVPAAARSRYMVHLADCRECRGVVVQLTQASGAAVSAEPIKQETGSGFWLTLAALFSSPVLRYAIPAVALTAVIGISFFALRTREDRPYLTAQTEANTPVAPGSAIAPPAGSPLPLARIETPSETQGGTESKLRFDTTAERKGFQDESPRVAKAPATTADSDATGFIASKRPDQAKPSFRAGADRPVFAPEPASAAPPPPPAKAANKEEDKASEVQQQELSKREVQNLPVQNQRNQPRDDRVQHGPSRNNNVINEAPRAEGLTTERGESRAKSKKDSEEETETRTVSGKRF